MPKSDDDEYSSGGDSTGSEVTRRPRKKRRTTAATTRQTRSNSASGSGQAPTVLVRVRKANNKPKKKRNNTKPSGSARASNKKNATSVSQEEDEQDSPAPTMLLPPFAPTGNSLKTPTDPVEGKPGLFADSDLKKVGYAIYVEFGVLYCQLCNFNPQTAHHLKEPVGICSENALNHTRDHHGNVVNTALKANSAILRGIKDNYDVWKGPRSEFSAPIPRSIIAPNPNLKIVRAGDKGVLLEACAYCDGPFPTIWANTTGRWNHLAKAHNGKAASDRDYLPARAVAAAQTFHSQGGYVRYFQVDSSLALPATNHSESASDAGSENASAAAAQMYISYITRSSATSSEVMGSGHGLTRETSFIYRHGWSGELAGFLVLPIMGLVAEPGRKDVLYPVETACELLFRRYLLCIRSATPAILHSWMDTDAQKNRYTKAFNAVTEDATIRNYSLIFAKLVCLAVRSAELLDTNPDQHRAAGRYVPNLPNPQRLAAKAVLSALKPALVMEELMSAIQNLALTFFAPQDAESIGVDRFNNITYTYVMLRSVNRDTSFQPTKNLVYSTSALQYLFRASLLYQATEESKKSPRRNKEIFEFYSKFLVINDMMYPFGTLKCLRQQMIVDVSRNRGMQDFHWLDTAMTQAKYKGHNFTIFMIIEMCQAMLNDTELFLAKEVLFDIPLEELGFLEPDFGSLQDTLEETKLGYSVWTDDSNQGILDMRHALAHAFITHPKLKGHFWRDKLPDGRPLFFEGPRREWLEKLGEFQLRLMGCTHVWGGQPRRASEHTNMLNVNLRGRPRSLMAMLDLFIFILGYSKTTAITMEDRKDVHALPPRVNRMLFILNAFIRPLAVQWVAELFDDPKETEQELAISPSPELAANPSPEPATNPSPEPVEHSSNDPEPTSDQEPARSSRSRRSSKKAVQQDADSAVPDMDVSQADDDDMYIEDLDDADSDYEMDLELLAVANELGLEAEELAAGEADQRVQQLNRPALSSESLRPSQIQSEMTFARNGKKFVTQDLSNIIGKYTLKYVGKEWGVAPWRHITAALQRGKLGYDLDDDTPVLEDTFMDLQRGHSTRVSHAMYAVQEDDRNLSSSTSILKYIEASQKLHAFLEGKPVVQAVSRAENIEKKVDAVQTRISGVETRVKEMSQHIEVIQVQNAELKAQNEELRSQNAELLGLVRGLVAKIA
ncbi:hypothetical protein FRC09_016006 [Ceratobasidium sp. 395]|nr:hypothetical protein FRC09_016006 [Ceratobasidium sp. 395]